jgi:hypothetical protein
VIGNALQHDPEKWTPVFRKDHAQTKKIERDDDSKKRHPARGGRDKSRHNKAILGRVQPLDFRLELEAQLRAFLVRQPVRHLRKDGRGRQPEAALL